MATHETKPAENGRQDGGSTDEYLHPNSHPDTALRKIRTAGSVVIPPELFEKLYLNPQTQGGQGQRLSKLFGNPTPLGLGGFLMALTPLTCDLLGWRGSGGADGSANIGAFLFFGGLVMAIAGVQEWIVGNTYISVVFTTFAAFWLTFGATLQPFYYAYGNYSPNPSNEAAGLKTPAFNAAFGFFLVFMGLLCIIYLIGSLRTNMVLFGILFPLPFAFGFLAASFWYTAEGKATYAATMLTAGASFLFVTDMLGWYLFAALMFAAVDLPIQLPVGDLSHRVKGYSETHGKTAAEDDPEAAGRSG